jgi:hypothetical protein
MYLNLESGEEDEGREVVTSKAHIRANRNAVVIFPRYSKITRTRPVGIITTAAAK